MQKPKKLHKQLKPTSNPPPQTYLTSISSLFMHPSELIYVLINTQNLLCIFDIPTMSMIGKSYMRIKLQQQIYKVIFCQDDIGLFYTLSRSSKYGKSCKNVQDIYSNTNSCQSNINQQPKRQTISNNAYNYTLNKHYLTKNNQIMWQHCKLDLTDYFYKPQPQLSPLQPPQNSPKPKQFTLLQISKYTRQLPNKLQNSTNQPYPTKSYSLPQQYFTILSSNGFHICTPKQQINYIQLSINYPSIQIITGINIYGNTHGYTNTKYKDRTSSQVQDLWIVFTLTHCLLLDTSDCTSSSYTQKMIQQQQRQLDPSQRYPKSKLQLKINKSYYQPSSPSYPKPKPPHHRPNQLPLDPHKKLLPILTTQNQIVLITYITNNHYKLAITGKIKLDAIISSITSHSLHYNYIQNYMSYIINCISVMRFGVNTSTTNKYQNKVIIILAVNTNAQFVNGNTIDNHSIKTGNMANQINQHVAEHKQNDKQIKQSNNAMEEENKNQEKQKEKNKEQNKTNCDLYMYSFELNQNPSLTFPQNTMNAPNIFSSYPPIFSQSLPEPSSKELLSILKDFSQSYQIWYNQYLENKINYLSTENKVQMIDICKILQNKNIGKQWINLSYRFEPLQSNQLYQQLQDQFQITAQQSKDSTNLDLNTLKNKIRQFNDWSYCMISKSSIQTKKLKRLNCISF